MTLDPFVAMTGPLHAVFFVTDATLQTPDQAEMNEAGSAVKVNFREAAEMEDGDGVLITGTVAFIAASANPVRNGTLTVNGTAYHIAEIRPHKLPGTRWLRLTNANSEDG